MTKMQDILGRILRNRINADIKNGRLETDKESLVEILDIFIAGDKITAEQYSDFTELIAPTTVEPTSQLTAS